MTWIYAVTALFGGLFLVPMLLSGLDIDLGGGDIGDGGIDLDGDIGGDIGGEIGGGLDGIGTDLGGGFDSTVDGPDMGGEAIGAVLASLVSVRTVVFFSSFFGSAGLVLTAIGYGRWVTLISAGIVGTFAGAANSILFGLVRGSEANSQISDRTFQGRRAVVVLPMGDGRRGRVKIDLGGQPQYVVALPVDDGQEQRFDVGDSVVVVEIENGTAMVTSLADLDLEEES